MSLISPVPPPSRGATGWLAALLPALLLAACAPPAPGGSAAFASRPGAERAGTPTDRQLQEQVLRGRRLVIAHGCGDCHGGGSNPAAEGWLAGRSAEGEAERIGPHRFWPRNLTPDAATGIGGFSDRQIFNALRYGLRPGATADVEVSSAVPGEGGHPLEPSYLAPIMPWSSFRHMPDEELLAVTAYLRHGVRPVGHRVPDPQTPPDRWASHFTRERIGVLPLPAFPTATEQMPAPERRAQVLLGRTLVVSLACGECHGGRGNPAADGWLAGLRSSADPARTAPFEQEFAIGSFRTRSRNLTPDNATGLGRFSERQIFNSLRYGLRPGETADVEITSGIPGEGNHPVNPKYLAPPMPWTAWRHLSDEELRAIAAYLKEGLRPARNRVPDSEGPPDFWAGAYTPEAIGPHPAPAFPTANERRPDRPE
jgi:mono/diheme cytochrome c family protein